MSVNYPELESCVYTSIVKDLDGAVRGSIFEIACDNANNGRERECERETVFDLNNEGVVATAEWRQVPGLPPDLQTRIDTARQQIQAGLIETCPTRCPTRERPEAEASPGPETSPAAGTDANASSVPVEAVGNEGDSNPDV
jgi:basic membrane lipoprotein Med (substrate-binding protein (PBP1-ABC) superfamily)